MKSSLDRVDSKSEEQIQEFDNSVKTLLKELITENKMLKNENSSLLNKVQSLEQKNNKLVKKVKNLRGQVKDLYEPEESHHVARKKLQEIGKQLQREVNNQ